MCHTRALQRALDAYYDMIETALIPEIAEKRARQILEPVMNETNVETHAKMARKAAKRNAEAKWGKR